jgi:hypothetical protein
MQGNYDHGRNPATPRRFASLVQIFRYGSSQNVILNKFRRCGNLNFGVSLQIESDSGRKLLNTTSVQKYGRYTFVYVFSISNVYTIVQR